jgi:hypothetical protein
MGARWQSLRAAIRWTRSATIALAVIVGVGGGPVAAVPINSPCMEMRPADIGFEMRLDPADPAVGDLVDLDVRITTPFADRAAIPLFRLLGVEPAFVVEAQDNSYPALAYARYRLRATASGDATLRVAVNFATAAGCGDAPAYVFRFASSPPLAVHVRDAEPEP